MSRKKLVVAVDRKFLKDYGFFYHQASNCWWYVFSTTKGDKSMIELSLRLYDDTDEITLLATNDHIKLPSVYNPKYNAKNYLELEEELEDLDDEDEEDLELELLDDIELELLDDLEELLDLELLEDTELIEEDDLELWESVRYRMDEEGFDYCFESYSHWDEIKDEEFHRLRLEFLRTMSELRNYIEKKVEEGQEKEWDGEYLGVGS